MLIVIQFQSITIMQKNYKSLSNLKELEGQKVRLKTNTVPTRF